MSIRVLYNEIDPFCCSWLSNLMDAGLIRPGVICDRSIADLSPDDVRGYDLVHYFAGLAGWDYALTLAGWKFDGRVTWTGSCPCQPFSSAGKGAGFNDPRHLWPAWFRLIKECRPPACFGEQVSSPAGVLWFDALRDDMDSCGYAVAAVDLPACSVGAPHIRQRLWWVGYAAGERRHGGVEDGHRLAPEVPRAGSQDDDGLGYAEGERRDGRPSSARSRGRRGAQDAGGMGHAMHSGHEGPERAERTGRVERPLREAGGSGSGLADRDDSGRRGSPQRILEPEAGLEAQRGDHADGRGMVNPWADLAWVECSDGRARPVPAAQPALFPLAPRLPGRVGRLRAYGNAISPPVASAFIEATARRTSRARRA